MPAVATDPKELDEDLLSDPDSIVGVRLGDVQELEQRATAAEASLEDARIDLAAIIGVLNCAPPGDVTPHELIQNYILPRCRLLMATQNDVDHYADELRQRTANGAPTIDVAPGVKAVRVGGKRAGIDPRALRGGVQQHRGKGPGPGER